MAHRSIIHLENCQIKSIEKARLLCMLLDTMEKEFGVREVEISFKDMFICPDINLTQLNRTPMEILASDIFIRMDKRKYGKKSNYKKKNEP